MENAQTSSYGPPVDQLLTYGEGQSVTPDAWPNYLALGLGPEQIPDLIRMATDEDLNWSDSDGLEVWGPVHAWRTLGHYVPRQRLNRYSRSSKCSRRTSG